MPSAETLFLEILDRYVSSARVSFLVNGRELAAGQGEPSGEHFRILVHSPKLFENVLCFGNLGLGEAFMRGYFEMESGSLTDFLTVLLRSRLDEHIHRTVRLAVSVAAIRVLNALRTRESNVQRHYDLGVDLFEAFLDPTLTYSCGFARTPEDDLATLQQNKFERICRKLHLEPGLRLLDIGCGFGGLLIFAAEKYGIRGVGITISRSQWERANAEVRRRGLSSQIEIEFREYRDVKGPYDRIVSVGMLEHVPASEYVRYFRTIAAALDRDGIGLVHAIGCNAGANVHDPFIQKYIFPSSNQPRLSELASNMEQSGLQILDVENIIRHYGYTSLAWLERFLKNKNRLDQSVYNGTFQRMWEYYLSCAVAASRASNAAVYQILFQNDRSGEIPLCRV